METNLKLCHDPKKNGNLKYVLKRYSHFIILMDFAKLSSENMHIKSRVKSITTIFSAKDVTKYPNF